MCRGKGGRRFAESTENDLSFGDVPEERNRKLDLKARNSFPGGSGNGSSRLAGKNQPEFFSFSRQPPVMGTDNIFFQNAST